MEKKIKKCKYCNADIYWVVNDEGKNQPMSLDETEHNCLKNGNGKAQKETVQARISIPKSKCGHDWRCTFDQEGTPKWFYCTKCREVREYG